MKKFLKLIMALSLGLAIAGCAKEYDDTALTERVKKVEDKVNTLDQKVSALTEQVTGLAAVIDQWKKGGFVESVEDVKEGGVVVGYTIKFVGGQTVTLKNGKDGKDGTDGKDGKDGTNGKDGVDGQNGQNGQDGEDGKDGVDGKTPGIVIVDGEAVWAIDGTPIEVEGKYIPATVVPSFKINDAGHLIMTIAGKEYDLGKVVGQGGDSLFTSVDASDPDVVKFELSNGTKFEVPKAKAFKLIIETPTAEVIAGDVVEFPFTIQNGTAEMVDCFAGGNYLAEIVDSKVVVTVPDPFAPGKVLVWAQNDKGLFSMVKLSFTEGPNVIVINPEDVNGIPEEGGEFIVNLTSNIDIELNAEEIPDWITPALTKADYKLTLNIAANTTAEAREAEIKIYRSSNKAVVQTVKVAQVAADLSPNVVLDFTAQGYTNAEAVDKLTIDNVTATFDVGTGSNPPKYYTTGTSIRCYAKNTITVASSKNYIKSIKFVYGSRHDGMTPNNGTLTDDTWTAEGNLASVTFALDGDGTPQVHFQKMKVYIGEEIPKELTIKTLFAKYSTDSEAWNSYYGGTGGTDRNIAMDDEYIYIAESSATAKLWAISVADPNQVKLVNVEGVSGGAHALTCPRVVKNTNAEVNGGKDVLICCNLTRGGEDPKLYIWANGIDNAPKAITLTTWATSNWYGDTFTVWGTLQNGVLMFDKTNTGGDGVVTFHLNGVPAGSAMYLVGRIKTVDAFGSHTGTCAFYPIPDGTAGVYSPGRGTEARGQFATLGSSLKSEGGINVTLTPLDYDEGTNAFVLGYNFIEWEGHRYVIYGNYINNKKGYIRVRQGELTDAWSTVASTGTRLYRRDLISGGLASGNSAMDITARVINGDLYIAAQMQNVGFGLYKLCYE